MCQFKDNLGVLNFWFGVASILGLDWDINTR